jgi:DNA-binding NarL/FixJ family response regulator
MPRIPVVVCHQQPLMRASLKALFEQYDEIRVVGETKDPSHAAVLAYQVGADVVVMSFDHDEAELLGTTYRTNGVRSGPSVVALANIDSDDSLLAAIRSGARAVLSTDSDPEDMIQAITAAANSQGWMPPEAIGRLLDLLAPRIAARSAVNMKTPLTFTAREQEIVYMVACGASNNEVAKRLHLTNATVRSHVHHVLTKVGLRNRAQLVAYVYQRGLVSLLPGLDGCGSGLGR